MIDLRLGDCVDVMRTLDASSVDAIVTDPPYGLEFMGKDWDSFKVGRSENYASGGSIAERTGKFDGPVYVHRPAKRCRTCGKQAWSGSPCQCEAPDWEIDNSPLRAFQAWCEAWARECLRVLKPGGHLLAFGGSRTYHRMACAIEDAGFEVRDQIMWIYGSGFPKSLDVSKAIDKTRGEDLEPVRAICRVIRAAMDARGLKSRDLIEHFGNCDPRLVDHWAARDTDSQPSLPTLEQWGRLRELLSIDFSHDAEVRRLTDRKGQAGDAYRTAEVLGEHSGQTPGFGEHRFAVVDRTIRAATDAARAWDGWGTALKPAHEPIVVARKPLSGTVAANVLAHGTGALNIDGCRIGTDGATTRSAQTAYGESGWRTGHQIVELNAGRWPANVIHDGSDEVVALFPDVDGGTAMRANQTVSHFGNAGASLPDLGYGDTGSAARFFYCAKASAEDRNEGVTTAARPVHGPSEDDRVWDIPGSKSTPRANFHPTVKPTELMRYLVRLVTPPGGLVLDPFTGSGSTGKACALEDFRFIGIERDPEYFAIASARIEHAMRQPKQQALELPTVQPMRAPAAEQLSLLAAD